MNNVTKLIYERRQRIVQFWIGYSQKKKSRRRLLLSAPYGFENEWIVVKHSLNIFMIPHFDKIHTPGFTQLTLLLITKLLSNERRFSIRSPPGFNMLIVTLSLDLYSQEKFTTIKV